MNDDEEFERLLRQAEPPQVPAALRRRILADFDRIATRPGLTRLLRLAADAIWPDAPLWQPAGALALALVVGIGVAALAPLEGADGTDGASNLFAADLDNGGF